MPTDTKAQRIDELMELARAALARKACFEAERLANQALNMAHEDRDYQRMASLAPALREARPGTPL